MDLQHTIAKPASLSGRGLFSGTPVNVAFKPAPANHGVVFVRTDLQGAHVPAVIANVAKRPRRSALRAGDAVIETCEHVLSALAGLGIDNIVIEIDAAELPGLDGSSKPFVDALLAAGISPNDSAPRRRLAVSAPVVVRQDDMMLAATPSDAPGLLIVYDLDYSSEPAIGKQVKMYDQATQDYAKEIAPARTFVTEAEANGLRARGMGTHLTPMDVLVVGKSGPIGGNTQRFIDEPVRHKILDLIGDLYLLGAPIQGRIIAAKSGHALNHSLVRELVKQFRQQVHSELATTRNLIDIRKLQRILPHRYPMLLVDRVVEIDGDRRILGVKNVTVNEPFFQGHFPGYPVMPGVLVVEAMAQISGLLVGQKLENAGKMAILLSLDRVKLRKPVVPGDQLMLEAEAVRIRSKIAHMRCRAYVAEELAAEAEVKFMIFDAPKD